MEYVLLLKSQRERNANDCFYACVFKCLRLKVCDSDPEIQTLHWRAVPTLDSEQP